MEQFYLLGKITERFPSMQVYETQEIQKARSKDHVPHHVSQA